MASFGDLQTAFFFFSYTRITHINQLSCGDVSEMQKVLNTHLLNIPKAKAHFYGPHLPLFEIHTAFTIFKALKVFNFLFCFFFPIIIIISLVYYPWLSLLELNINVNQVT